MSKRIIPLLLCLVLALSVLFALPEKANAATAQETGNAILKEVLKQDGTFPETLPQGQTTHKAYCYVCGAEKEWKPLTSALSDKFSDGDHYYVPKAVTASGQVFQMSGGKSVCVHTNGKTFTDSSYRFAIVGGRSVLNIMGGGTISANPASGVRGAIFVNASILNIYGTTIVSAETSDRPALSLYNSSAVVNAWGATLDAGSKPVISTNGTVNLYNCTAIGTASIQDDPNGGNGGTAVINLVDSTLPGITDQIATVKVSGAAKITGTGLVLPSGVTLDPTGLTEGAQIVVGRIGAVTPIGTGDYAKYFRALGSNQLITVDTKGSICCVNKGPVMVAADGTQTGTEDALKDWKTGKYAYIKLCGEYALDMNGEDILVDLAGNDLIVAGTGNLRTFDTANDTFNANACGTVINNGTVNIAASVNAPNGSTYITVVDSNRATAHRLDIKLDSVSLRTSAAGLYYKAKYECDHVLEQKVTAYGVVLSLHNMPGADFKEESLDGNYNAWTEATAAFQSGITATSGSVFNIMKADRANKDNDAYAKLPIYANPYIVLGDGAPIVANTADAGLKVGDPGFAGTAMSLYDVLMMLDSTYNSQNTAIRLQLDAFYSQWKDSGMNWDFANIGKNDTVPGGVDNSDIELKFDAGTTDAECPVCKKKVTWTELTVKDTHQDLQGHYYLTKDLSFEKAGDAFFFNSKRNTTLCVHLNGHDLTATKTRVVHGSTGRTNIIGNGIVTGYQSSKEAGAAVQVNNYIDTQSVHLYGGTYKKTVDSHADAAPLAINAAGGEINVYEGVTVENAKGVAIIVKTPTNVNTVKAKLSLHGGTINGKVVLQGNDGSANKAIPTAEFVNCTVNGTVEVALNSDVYLTGAPVIKSIDMHKEERLVPMGLTDGANIGLTNKGVFTERDESYEAYTEYFHGSTIADMVMVKNGALYCGPDYTGNLKFVQGTTEAVCPVCAKQVTWETVDGTAQLNNSTEKKTKHYYLEKDVVYTANSADILSYIDPGHGNHTVCLHLNGNDLTLTDTRLVYGGTSVTNVMGSGVVTGVRGDKYNPGGVIQINVSAESGAVNLYGGTYRHGEYGANSQNDFTISISGNGGTVNIYEDALVEANSNGKAIFVGGSNMRSSQLGIYGTVNGWIYSEGANPAKGKTTTITADGATINGRMELKGVSSLILAHDVKIEMLDMAAESLATMDSMTVGASVTIKRPGVFTKPHDSAEKWAEYFTGCNPGDKIILKDGALRCKTDFEAKVYPNAQGEAFCPVCQKTVTWTPITSNARVQATGNSHYYLTTDILYEKEYSSSEFSYFYGGEKTGITVCLNLNGHNITATKTHAIYGGYGVLNVFGSGIVTGYTKSGNNGGAVQINNSVAGNCLNLYSGTYRNATNSVENSGVVAVSTIGSKLCIYEDAFISNPDGLTVAANISRIRDTNLEIYGATIDGDVKLLAPSKEKGDFNTKLILDDAVITGKLDVAAGNAVTVTGLTKIGQLNLAEGQLVTFQDMKTGSSVKISANGAFTEKLTKADEWLQFFTPADTGKAVFVRNGQLVMGVIPTITTATEADKAALLNTYAGATLRYGEMHNHTNSGPFRDDGTGFSPSTGADGKKSLDVWITEMDRLKMDFAFIVDHGMSIHMYHENFRPDYFIGGTEPGTTITDSNASTAKPHYNMLFAYPDQLESIFFKWESKYKPIKWNKENYPTALTPSEEGYRVRYPSFTTEEFKQLAQDVYAAGGLLVQVHPKYSGYIVSDDPLDYYFADYTGIEISTGNGKAYNMMYSANNKAYNLWVDLLELGKKVFATAGSDGHSFPDYSGLTAMYTVNDHKDDYMAGVRVGNMAPGWVGIRMNVNGTAMGGETDFTGKRLQFSVGDMYNAGEKDYCNTPAVYVPGHSYRVDLYDEGGILMSAPIDPIGMNYFAIDCDADAKFYRVVVWDETDNERVGVSNPIWNTAN